MQVVYFNFFRKIPVFSAVSTVSAVFSKIFQKRHKKIGAIPCNCFLNITMKT